MVMVPVYGETEFVLYKNQAFNYKIIIPRGWEKVDLNLQNKSIMYATKGKTTEIKVRAYKSTEKDIESLIHETKWNLRRIDPKLNEILETEQIEIKKNITGKLIIFEYRLNRKNILSRVMITKDANMIYIIECRSSISTFYTYDNIFTTALSSFGPIQAGDDEL